MNIDEAKMEEVVLALMFYSLHDGSRAWKSYDWGVLDRLHENGFIANPVGKSKSVVFTDAGLEEARRVFKKHFERK